MDSKHVEATGQEIDRQVAVQAIERPFSHLPATGIINASTGGTAVDDIKDQTIWLWTRRGATTLSAEDARQAICNAAGFFSQISKWGDRTFQQN